MYQGDFHDNSSKYFYIYVFSRFTILGHFNEYETGFLKKYIEFCDKIFMWCSLIITVIITGVIELYFFSVDVTVFNFWPLQVSE